LKEITRYWWLVALRGAAAVLFGVACILWPGLSLLVLVLLFGAYALVDGIFAIGAAIATGGRHGRWWGLLIEGIVGVGAGILTFVFPGITAFALLILIAAWAIVTGVLEVVAAIRLRQEMGNEVLLVLSGIASVLFGAILFAAPTAGALAVVWLIGAYSLIAGLLLLVLGFKLRGMRQQTEGQYSHSPALG